MYLRMIYSILLNHQSILYLIFGIDLMILHGALADRIYTAYITEVHPY